MKTIRFLLLGPSGGGKTSLLNLVNLQSQLKTLSLLDVSSALVKTDFLSGDYSNCSELKSSTVSQTIRPMLYKISDIEIDEETYNIEIIDTPGFLDTDGKGRDLENLALIRKYIGTLKLNGILIVIDKYRVLSSDESSNYVKNMLSQIVGSNSDKNLLTLITNAFHLPASEADQIKEKMGEFFNYDNDVFNKQWDSVKVANETERKLEKHLLPKLKGIFDYFGGFEQNTLVGLQELDSKIDALRNFMELYYNTEKKNLLFQIENNSKQISFWEKYFPCCFKRKEKKEKSKMPISQNNELEKEIKSTISFIFQNNKNSNVLMELSEFKKIKNKNNLNETNQERGIYFKIIEKMEKVFEDALLENYKK